MHGSTIFWWIVVSFAIKPHPVIIIMANRKFVNILVIDFMDYQKLDYYLNFKLLQDFDIQPDPMGNTHIRDLSQVDLDHLRSLTLIELTALFDNNNILWSRRKTKKKLKGKSDRRLCSLPYYHTFKHHGNIKKFSEKVVFDFMIL